MQESRRTEAAMSHGRGWVFAVGLWLWAANAFAQTLGDDLRASVTLMSDYRHNGLSQSDGQASLRVSLDYEHGSGFFAGGFVASVDYAAEAGRRTPRDLQTNLYAGYAWRGAQWAASASVSRYIYPGIDFRYDYTLTTLSASFRDRYFISASRTSNLLSLERSATHVEIGAAFPWSWDLELGINAGRFRARDFFDTDYSHWDVGLSKIVGRFALDLRFHSNTADAVTILGDPGGERWVFSAAYAIAPRE